MFGAVIPQMLLFICIEVFSAVASGNYFDRRWTSRGQNKCPLQS